MPYSCHAQLGRSGCSGCPYGGGRTVRGMLRSIDHSSTLTMVHTARRASFGSLRGGRSTIAEYGTRSLGSFIGPNPTFATGLATAGEINRVEARHLHQPRSQRVVGAG